MIAVDSNVLVYAHRGDSEWHDVAAEKMRGLAEGNSNWALLWPCVHEFLAVVTHARIYSPPTPMPKAIAQVDAWLESPNVVLLAEGDGHWTTLRAALTKGAIRGPQVHDARIAVLCVQHGVKELWTADRDFSRFPDLRTQNPLVD